ncbi:DNA primase [Hymenobacter sp. 15J16-1T3B]|uniref:DNA primase n=1 Tax=Hymenobacter sp. 15J16-1T3B TaxID=2886941 RepID=UPI001D118C27|nr:DNA primase [Hymenobacter sp. 15J16-1T3B]MCC3156991.1 DNA primase [Hymenobacter sp. 15J16-1T3B]
MALIPKETIDQVLHYADIVEVVGDFVSLKKKGQNLWACCPFHHEKSPSFSVAPAKGIYKCFGCGKAGDVVRFVMDIESVSYPEAIKWLAKKYGVEIKEEEKTPEQQLAQNERDSQYIVSDWAKNRYKTLLRDSEEGESIGWAYLKERGLNQQTIDTFELGYSLDKWDDVLTTAQQAGFDVKFLEKTGLVIKREEDGRRYDRFRGRVMFPIHNISGRVVGFGARTLRRDEKAGAKYLNSPESEIYHKSDVLYGLYQAKQAIRQEELCYLVEGYLDVISLHQGGVKNVVASSGTSLTEGQIRLISRYTDNVTVLYDGDAAGIRAALRGLDIILENGLNVRVVLFPDGDDPDSYIRKVGDQRFRRFVEENSQDFISFKTRLVAKDAANDPVKKAEAIREVLQSIAKVPDPLKRQVFLQQTSVTFHIDEQVLIDAYNKQVKQAAPGPRPGGAGGAAAGSPARTSGNNAALRPASSGASVQPGGQLTGISPRPTSPGYDDSMPDEAYGFMGDEEGEPTGDALDLEPVPDVQQACEREVVRLILNYPAQPLADGVPVAEYLLGQVDETPFRTPLYADLLHLCNQAVQAGRFPDARELVRHERGDIRAAITDLVTELHELSPNWITHQIYVPRELDQLQTACENAILRLNKCNVERELTECLNTMNSLNPNQVEEYLAQMAIFKSLKQLDMQLAGLLGTIISR